LENSNPDAEEIRQNDKKTGMTERPTFSRGGILSKGIFPCNGKASKEHGIFIGKSEWWDSTPPLNSRKSAGALFVGVV
jgi:hypothetical protein